MSKHTDLIRLAPTVAFRRPAGFWPVSSAWCFSLANRPNAREGTDRKRCCAPHSKTLREAWGPLSVASASWGWREPPLSICPNRSDAVGTVRWFNAPTRVCLQEVPTTPGPPQAMRMVRPPSMVKVSPVT
jgi:hypothetical protein